MATVFGPRFHSWAPGPDAITSDADAARASYEDYIGALADYCDGFRLVKVTLAVPLPRIVKLSGIAPEVGSRGTLTVK
jgi:hypothetical protein